MVVVARRQSGSNCADRAVSISSPRVKMSRLGELLKICICNLFIECLTFSLSYLTWLLIAMLYYVMWPMSLTNDHWYMFSPGMTLVTIVSCMVVTLHRLVCQKIKVNSVWINTTTSGLCKSSKSLCVLISLLFFQKMFSFSDWFPCGKLLSLRIHQHSGKYFINIE